MKRKGMLGWMYQYALTELFDADMQTMAQKLHVSMKTLEVAEDSRTDEAMIVVEQLLLYCRENRISVDAIISQYVNSI